MAKDRNTFAKRQREVEKKRKRDEKRQRRAQKKTDDESVADDSASLSQAERAVLDVFRKYLMTPGKMLCFSQADLENFDAPLDQLTSKGLLVADQHQGGFSLSETGFAAMTASD